MPAQIVDCHLWAFQPLVPLRIPVKARPGKSPFFRVFKFGAFCVAFCIVEVNGSGDPLCLLCQFLTLRPFAPIVRCGYLFDWFDNSRRKTPEKREKLFDRFEFAAVGRSCVVSCRALSGNLPALQMDHIAHVRKMIRRGIVEVNSPGGQPSENVARNCPAIAWKRPKFRRSPKSRSHARKYRRDCAGFPLCRRSALVVEANSPRPAGRALRR